MTPPAPYAPKDFTLIRHDGVFHLFYIRRDLTLPPEQTENDFGHAISYDLHTWAQLPPVLPVAEGQWDNRHVWAPHVIEAEGLFYLFYTGVTDSAGVFAQHQRIGVATSSDLMQWNRAEGPVLDCTQIPSAACDPLNPAFGLRDANVIADPDDPGQYWMYVAMNAASNPASMVVGTAGTDRLPTGWVEHQPLWVTNTAITGSDLAESPHALKHAGRWFLMWTSNGIQPIVWASAPSAVAPDANWLYKGPIAGMVGIDTSPWFASEHMRVGMVDYFAAASQLAIEILRMDWETDSTFKLVQPSATHVLSVSWLGSEVSEGETATLRLAAVNPLGTQVPIEVHEIDAGGNDSLIPNAAIGLPDMIELTADTTSFDWVAVRWPDADDLDSTDTELQVRLVDQTAVSPVLRVVPAQNVGVAPREESGAGDMLRFLPRSPLGAAFHVEMASAGRARLDVLDVQGRLVRTLADGFMPAGTSLVPWVPHDRDGGRLAAGVYFVTLVTDEARRTVRLAVLN